MPPTADSPSIDVQYLKEVRFPADLIMQKFISFSVLWKERKEILSSIAT